MTSPFEFVVLGKAAVVSNILRPAGWRGRVTRPEFETLKKAGVLEESTTASPQPVSRRKPRTAVPPAHLRTEAAFDEEMAPGVARFDEDQAGRH